MVTVNISTSTSRSHQHTSSLGFEETTCNFLSPDIFRQSKMAEPPQHHIPLPSTHPALTNFVILKTVFKELSIKQLRVIRSVCRHWSFAATSEIIKRQYSPPDVLLREWSAFFKDYPADYSYKLYADFETRRREMWRVLYGDDCALIEFRNLFFKYPSKSKALRQLLQSPWMSSVTRLSIAAEESTCHDLLINCFLPSFPCLTTLVVDLRLKDPNFDADFGYFHLDSVAPFSIDNDIKEQESRKYPNVTTVVVAMSENCTFPWVLLDSFNLKDLRLFFGESSYLIDCAKDVVSKISRREVEFFEIELKHPKPPSLVEQVCGDTVLQTEAYAQANAALCNHFPSQNVLHIDSMIPAVYIDDFFTAFESNSNISSVYLEIACPLRVCLYGPLDHHHMLRQNMARNLVRGITSKLSNVKDLKLQYIQYHNEAPLPVALDFYAIPTASPKLEKLHLKTLPAHVFDTLLLLDYPAYMNGILQVTFPNLSELVYEVGTWMDCAAIIELLRSKQIKKLVLKEAPYFRIWMHSRINLDTLFPALNPDFKKNWCHGGVNGRDYQGLPGILSLEELHLEGFGVEFKAVVESEIGKMSSLKSIYLDPGFNQIGCEKSSGSVWPDSIGDVSIHVNWSLLLP